jgi:hypothetical protein
VPDAARNGSVRVFAREFPRIGTGFRMRGAIGITFKGDRRHGNHRTFGKSLFQIVIFRFTFSQTETPTVIVDDDADVIRIVERGCAAIEGGVIEVPFR